MRKTTTITVLLIFTNFIFGNKIDSLKTTKDIVKFVKSVNPNFGKYEYGKFDIRPTDSITKKIRCREILEEWEIKNWQKIDINNDGLTDLLFIPYYYGFSQFAIIDKGNDSFTSLTIFKNFDRCEFIKPIKVNDKNELRIRKVKRRSFNESIDNESNNFKIDTLTYKFDSFIEFNDKNIEKYSIESISIRTSGCYGPCPVFELLINKNGETYFNGIEYTKFIGKSKSNINWQELNEIEQLIEYIEIKKLEDRYSVNWTDDMTVYLKISFEDGSVKEIKDYGLMGTFGLASLYSKLIQIGTETPWK